MVLVWFVTSLLIAIVVPNIGDVISVLGGLAALFAFMFPGMIKHYFTRILMLQLRQVTSPVQLIESV